MKKNKHRLVTLGILFTVATGIIYLINRIVFASATLKDLLKSSADNYYNWRFGKIYYKKKGSGSPILLIHDLTVYSSAYEWKNPVFRRSTRKFPAFLFFSFFVSSSVPRFFPYLQQIFNALSGLFLLEKFF